MRIEVLFQRFRLRVVTSLLTGDLIDELLQKRMIFFSFGEEDRDDRQSIALIALVHEVHLQRIVSAVEGVLAGGVEVELNQEEVILAKHEETGQPIHLNRVSIVDNGGWMFFVMTL